MKKPGLLGNRNAAGPQHTPRSPEHKSRLAAAAKRRWANPQARVEQAARLRNRRVIGECAYCGGPATGHDHLVPRSRGGSSAPENIVLACQSCNASKGKRTPEEWLGA